jgi:hypothetical protein
MVLQRFVLRIKNGRIRFFQREFSTTLTFIRHEPSSNEAFFTRTAATMEQKKSNQIRIHHNNILFDGGKHGKCVVLFFADIGAKREEKKTHALSSSVVTAIHENRDLHARTAIAAIYCDHRGARTGRRTSLL